MSGGLAPQQPRSVQVIAVGLKANDGVGWSVGHFALLAVLPAPVDASDAPGLTRPINSWPGAAPRPRFMETRMRIPLDLPPGLNGDDTSFAGNGRWADGSNVRFRLGRAQVIGGWEALVATPLTGVCRAVLPWTDNAAVLNIAFGTHSKLQLWQGGALFDITPASGFTAGAIDGAGSAGYGTGAYGVGGFGQPSITDYFPLT